MSTDVNAYWTGGVVVVVGVRASLRMVSEAPKEITVDN